MTRAVICLEVIGENYRHHLRLVSGGSAKDIGIKQYINLLKYGGKKHKPWVAKITENGLTFMDSVRDYSKANSIGSRGIFEYYALCDGLYAVNECVRLGESRRYCVEM